MADNRHQLRPGPTGRAAFPLGRPAAALALLLAASLAALAVGCGPPTADAVARDFFNAWKAGTDAKAASLAVEGDLSAFRDGDTFLQASRPDFSVGAPEVSGDNAYVPLTLHLEEGDRDCVAVLRRQGRTWKVSLTATMTAWTASRPSP
jgi:hypothetical protein